MGFPDEHGALVARYRKGGDRALIITHARSRSAWLSAEMETEARGGRREHPRPGQASTLASAGKPARATSKAEIEDHLLPEAEVAHPRRDVW